MSKPNPPRPAKDSDPRLFVQAVEKAFRVLEAIGQIGHPASLSEIAEASGLDKSGAQRLCYTLRQLGYLDADPQGRGLMPGLRLMDRSYDFLRMHPLIERAQGVLTELRRNTLGRVDLSLLDDLTVAYVIRLHSTRETFVATLLGRRVPTFCSSGGHAMMALMDEAAVEDILIRSDRKPLTPKTITDLPTLRARIAAARENGYGLGIEQALLGEVVLAAAITDRQGRPIAAIHVAGSLSEWEVEDFVRRMAPLALEAARDLSN